MNIDKLYIYMYVSIPAQNNFKMSGDHIHTIYAC